MKLTYIHIRYLNTIMHGSHMDQLHIVMLYWQSSQLDVFQPLPLLCVTNRLQIYVHVV